MVLYIIYKGRHYGKVGMPSLGMPACDIVVPGLKLGYFTRLTQLSGFVPGKLQLTTQCLGSCYTCENLDGILDF